VRNNASHQESRVSDQSKGSSSLVGCLRANRCLHPTSASVCALMPFGENCDVVSAGHPQFILSYTECRTRYRRRPKFDYSLVCSYSADADPREESMTGAQVVSSFDIL
jgi:hypothetical protein